MAIRIKPHLQKILLPVILLLICAAGTWKGAALESVLQGSDELKALGTLLPYVPYALLVVVVALAWRFNSVGMLLAAVAVALVYRLATLAPGGAAAAYRIGAAVLLPVAIVFFSMLMRRRVLGAAGAFGSALILGQILVLWLISAPAGLQWASDRFPAAAGAISQMAAQLKPAFSPIWPSAAPALTPAALLLFLAAAALLLLRLLRNRHPLNAGFFWVLVAMMPTVSASPSGPAPMFFTGAAALIMIGAIVETTFSMAYHDDLTGLAGRRSLNEAMADLGKKYAIAMIDVDHFKKFNDTYGHDTGDQVLKLLATKLRQMPGGARVFRYGGEEFTALFPGKAAPAAVPFLESFRQDLAATPFVVRGKARKKGSAEQRGKKPKPSDRTVKVTVSIGVAGPGKALQDPRQVIKAADKALYRAKKNGRNQTAA